MLREMGFPSASAALMGICTTSPRRTVTLLMGVMTGARLVLAQPEGHKDAVYLGRLIREQRVTTLHFVPSMLQVMVESGELASCGSLRPRNSSGIP